jgi:hypothetical protein
MITCIHCFIKRFNVSNENIFFPFLSSLRCKIIIIKKKCNFHSSCFYTAIWAVIFSFCYAWKFSEYCKLHYGNSNFIKTYSFCCSRRCNALWSKLYIRIFLQFLKIRFPILHWACNNASFASNWFITKVIDYIIFFINIYNSLFNWCL